MTRSVDQGPTASQLHRRAHTEPMQAEPPQAPSQPGSVIWSRHELPQLTLDEWPGRKQGSCGCYVYATTLTALATVSQRPCPACSGGGF